MKKQHNKHFMAAVGLLILFILYTIALKAIDVKPIGPLNTFVGFAALNEAARHLFGVHMFLYSITDGLSVVAFLTVLGFAALGLMQLIKRKKFRRVDSSLFVLGGFYLLVAAAYLLFEHSVVNYRPVLINNVLEASYPSSTTMLVMCVMITAMMQFHRLIQTKKVRVVMNTIVGVFTAAMVLGRMLSGVHWLTDILGGILLSGALIMLYYSVNEYVESKKLQPVYKTAAKKI